MEKEEYIKRAEKLGHSRSMIEETLREASEWEEKFHVSYDYSMDLVELPISDPDPTAECEKR